jgi:hypothetical protein
MKAGDLVAWTKYASEWSNGPGEGDYAGVVTRVIAPTRRRRSRARIEIFDCGETFSVGRRMVEVISASR